MSNLRERETEREWERKKVGSIMLVTKMIQKYVTCKITCETQMTKIFKYSVSPHVDSS